MTVDGDAPEGPGVRVLSTADGSEIGYVPTTGDVEKPEYHEDAGLVFVTTDEDHVHAIDPATGTERWETRASHVTLVTDEMAFLCAGATLWAYRTSDGTREWETTLLSEVDQRKTRLRNDTLVVEGGRYRDKRLAGVDTGSGDERWHYRPGDCEGQATEEGPVLVTFDSDDRDSDVARLDETTGSEQWSYTSDNISLSSHDVHLCADSVYLREYMNGTVTKLRLATGQEQWQSGAYHHTEALGIEDDTLLVCWQNSDLDYEFHRLDTDTGRSSWSTDVDEEISSVRIDDRSGDAFVGTEEYDGDGGSVYRFNTTTGGIKWEFYAGVWIKDIAIDEAPILAHTRSHTLHAVGKETGRVVWTFSDELIYTFETTDREVVIRGEDSYYVLRRDDGTVRLETDPDRATTGDGVFFTLEGSTLSAYPLTDRPEAFVASDRDDPTKVYRPDEADPNTPEKKAGEDAIDRRPTEVYERGTTDDDTGNRDSSVSFCPGCGDDVGRFGGIEFCPGCGTELTDPDEVTHCVGCGCDLAQYGDVAFCPECGSNLGS